MSPLNCKVQLPLTGSSDLKQTEDAQSVLTVGVEFTLLCRGEVKTLGAPELRLPEGEQFALKLLGVRQSQGSIELTVTSYQVNQHKLEKVELVDGELRYPLSPIEFEVVSVQNPQEPVQEPFGPFGPLALPMPTWLWGALVLLVVGIGFVVIMRLRRYLRHRRFLKEILAQSGAKTPGPEFFFAHRRWKQSLGYFQRDSELSPAVISDAGLRLREMWFLYLSRRLFLPASEVSDSALQRALKASLGGRDATNLQAKMSRVQKEMAKLKSSQLKLANSLPQKASGADLWDVQVLLVKLVEEIEQAWAQKENARIAKRRLWLSSLFSGGSK